MSLVRLSTSSQPDNQNNEKDPISRVEAKPSPIDIFTIVQGYKALRTYSLREMAVAFLSEPHPILFIQLVISLKERWLMNGKMPQEWDKFIEDIINKTDVKNKMRFRRKSLAGEDDCWGFDFLVLMLDAQMRCAHYLKSDVAGLSHFFDFLRGNCDLVSREKRSELIAYYRIVECVEACYKIPLRPNNRWILKDVLKETANFFENFNERGLKVKANKNPVFLFINGYYAFTKAYYDEAHRCFAQSARLGFTPAIRTLAHLYESGDGFARDSDQAKVYSRLAGNVSDSSWPMVECEKAISPLSPLIFFYCATLLKLAMTDDSSLVLLDTPQKGGAQSLNTVDLLACVAECDDDWNQIKAIVGVEDRKKFNEIENKFRCVKQMLSEEFNIVDPLIQLILVDYCFFPKQLVNNLSVTASIQSAGGSPVYSARAKDVTVVSQSSAKSRCTIM
jgi:hypothetical protein